MKRKTVSLRKAVNAKCRECIYDKHQKGTWLAQVAACTSTSCPLFDCRPQSTTTTPAAPEGVKPPTATS